MTWAALAIVIGVVGIVVGIVAAIYIGRRVFEREVGRWFGW